MINIKMVHLTAKELLILKHHAKSNKKKQTQGFISGEWNIFFYLKQKLIMLFHIFRVNNG